MAQTSSDHEPDLHHYRQLLRKPGDTNYYLERALPENPDFYQQHSISESSSRCRLDQIPEEEELLYPEENILQENPYFIADTKPGPAKPERGWDNGRKGHEVRNIGVWREHGELPPVPETYFNGLNFAERTMEITANQIEDGYMVIGGSMQTFEDHLHFIASDLETEESADSDLEDLNNWFLYSVEDGEPEELIEYRSREKIGDYLEELLL